MTSGIYQIINKVNGKSYIGSSIAIKRRWSQHKYKLRNNKHYNNYLQNSWNKYSEKKFSFLILEEIKANNKNKLKNKLLNIEQIYLDKLKPQYNILPNAGTFLGYEMTEEHKEKISKAVSKVNKGENHPWYGKKHTEEWKKMMSKKLSGKNNPMYGNTGAKNPMYNRKHSKKSINKNALSNSKLDKKDVINIRNLCAEGNKSLGEIANMYDLSKSSICEIKKYKRFKYIKEQ